MTFSELKAEVLRNAGENPSAPRFHTAAEAGDAINAAQGVFALLTLCLEDVASVPVAAGSLITATSVAAPRLIAPLRVELNGTRLQPGTLADFAALNPAWMDLSELSTPQRYAMAGWNGLLLFPVSDSDIDIAVRFATAPVALVADSDVPAIPEEDHSALPGYANFRLALKEGAEPLNAAVPGLRRFLATAQRRMDLVRSRSVTLHYDTEPTERWKTLLENPQWPLTSPA